MRRGRTVLAELDPRFVCPSDLLCRPNCGGLCALTLFRWPEGQLESCLGDVRAIRVWVPFWFCRPLDCCAGCGRYRRAHALCVETLLCKPHLCRHAGGIYDR